MLLAMPIFPLRMPPELRDALTQLAKREGRSLNAQIVYILQQYLAQLEKKAKR